MNIDQRQKINAFVFEAFSFERLMMVGVFALVGTLIIFIFVTINFFSIKPEITVKVIDIFKDMAIFLLGIISNAVTNTIIKNKDKKVHAGKADPVQEIEVAK